MCLPALSDKEIQKEHPAAYVLSFKIQGAFKFDNQEKIDHNI